MDNSNKLQQGTLKVSDDVIATIARLATSEVDGVEGLTKASVSFKQMFVNPGKNGSIKIKLAGDVVEISISVIVKFGNNFNNVYIEEAEHNQSSSTEFIRLFSKTIFNDKTLEEYFNKMNQGSDRNFKISNIFFRMIKCYMNPESTELYFEFKKTLFENDKYISESALRGLYACLGSTLDNCKDLSKINKNRELFELICHLNEKRGVSPSIFGSAGYCLATAWPSELR